jgi:hypothetical protein
MAVAVAGVPDHAFPVHDEVVWQGAVFELITLKLAGLRLQIGEIVSLLTDEPHAVLTVCVRIPRA